MEIKKEIIERHCSKCNTTKPIKEFCKDKYRSTGYGHRCKKCRREESYAWNRANPEKVKQANDKNKEKRKIFYNSPEGIECSRRAHLKRMYGLTLEEFNLMLKQQNNKCAICGGTETHDKHGVLAVDHCHETGQIRELLCYKCNAGIGLLNDNEIILKKAIKYLKKHKKL